MIKGKNGQPDIPMTLIVVVSCDLCAQKNTYGADQADLASSEMAMHIVSAHPGTATALALGLGL
jgi:hypothetical protein